MREFGRRPTLGELQRTTPWVWLWCERCQHHAPLACAVPVISALTDCETSISDTAPGLRLNRLEAAALRLELGANNFLFRSHYKIIEQ